MKVSAALLTVMALSCSEVFAQSFSQGESGSRMMQIEGLEGGTYQSIGKYDDMLAGRIPKLSDDIASPSFGSTTDERVIFRPLVVDPTTDLPRSRDLDRIFEPALPTILGREVPSMSMTLTIPDFQTLKERRLDFGLDDFGESNPKDVLPATRLLDANMKMVRALKTNRDYDEAMDALEISLLADDFDRAPRRARMLAAQKFRKIIDDTLMTNGTDQGGINMLNAGIGGLGAATLTESIIHKDDFCLEWRTLNAKECNVWRRAVASHGAAFAPENDLTVHSALVVVLRRGATDYANVCSGFKIAPGFAVTAAHCCPQTRGRIVFSEYAPPLGREQTDSVEIKVVHFPEALNEGVACEGVKVEDLPGLASRFAGNDIVLVQYEITDQSRSYTSIPVVDMAAVRTASTSGTRLPFELVILNGYGKNSTTDSLATDKHPALHMGMAPVASFDCGSTTALVMQLAPTVAADIPASCVEGREIAVGYPDFLTDTAPGDSGSPQLVAMDDGGVPRLAALSITSRAQSTGGAGTGVPGNVYTGSVNTRLDIHAIEWIEDIVGHTVRDPSLTKLAKATKPDCTIFDTLTDAATSTGKLAQYVNICQEFAEIGISPDRIVK